MKTLIALLIFSLCTLASAKDQGILRPKQFIANDVTGRVLVWQPWDSTWRKIKKGDRLWEESLVQVGENSTFAFTLESSEGFKGLKADSLQITINSPTLLRLRPDVPRRLTIGDFFIPKIPDVAKAEGEQKSILSTMEDAWYRFAANVLPQEISKAFLKKAKEENKEKATVSVKARRLKLYQPTHDQIYLTEKFPKRLKVSWKQVPTQSPFGIRVWHQADVRPPPLAYTKSSSYSVVVNREGTYLIQVETQDGVWQSETRRFQVLLPMAGRGKPPSQVAVERPIELELPPANFVFFTPKYPYPMAFQWNRPNTAVGKQIYEFRLTDYAGKALFTRTTSDTFLTVKFSGPGQYRWSVSARPSLKPESRRIYSESRSLVLEKKKPRSLADVFSTTSDKVYYLDAAFGAFR